MAMSCPFGICSSRTASPIPRSPASRATVYSRPWLTGNRQLPCIASPMVTLGSIGWPTPLRRRTRTLAKVRLSSSDQRSSSLRSKPWAEATSTMRWSWFTTPRSSTCSTGCPIIHAARLSTLRAKIDNLSPIHCQPLSTKYNSTKEICMSHPKLLQARESLLATKDRFVRRSKHAHNQDVYSRAHLMAEIRAVKDQAAGLGFFITALMFDTLVSYSHEDILADLA